MDGTGPTTQGQCWSCLGQDWTPLLKASAGAALDGTGPTTQGQCWSCLGQDWTPLLKASAGAALDGTGPTTQGQCWSCLGQDWTPLLKASAGATLLLKVLQVLTNLCCGKRKLSIIELKKTLEVDKDALSRLGPQEPAQETASDFSTACKWSCSYPVIFPPGPMDVLNMRLKSIGGERGLAVTGAVMENRVNMAASSSWL